MDGGIPPEDLVFATCEIGNTNIPLHLITYSFVKKYFFNLFLDRGEGRKRNVSVSVASRSPPSGDRSNPGMCSDWKSNQ